MENRSFIPRGAASYQVDYDGPPKDYYFVLLPKLTLLAFTSAIEPLRIANQITNRTLYRWHLMTRDGQPVSCSCGVTITPDSELIDISRHASAFICSGIEPAETLVPQLTTWISRQITNGAKVGGICTGAFALAKAGLLKRRRFTLHWENQPGFEEMFLDLTPTGTIYENDNGLLTCGGGSAATDMMLDIIENDHGANLAALVADMGLHTRNTTGSVPQQSAYAHALSSRNPHLIAAMDFMAQNIEYPVEITDIADEIGISRRQLERHFKRYVSATPAQFYLEMRINRAHALLNETSLSIAEIAAATGFGSSSQFSTRFRKRYGKPPNAYRKG
ncbi:HTH-type transcriptional regulator CdhR [Roseovarius albus]|uniref:HTH-type transcriptional regulator CdhR n=1 Tax=Roseovarius albus TaxID=1247867 RepID=A0A1X6ZFX7_9RHOB|nr:GlxA family transcriptional regulator [Roseovarius albus]SLN50612.1 HTH-type transcriptional regulator CdhR [Roseovarius albus]